MATDNAPPLSGTITVYNNTAVFTIIPVVDSLTEGLEYITMGVTTVTSDQVLASASVTIGDTGTPSVTSTPTTTSTSTPAPTNTPSSTSVPTYLLTANKTSMNEGDNVIFTITGSNIPNGTVVYWGSDVGLVPHLNTISGSDFGYPNDLTANTAVIVNNNYATFTLTAVNDLTTEGIETLAMTIRSSSGGPLLARASLITVNDTSMNVIITSTPTTTSTIGSPTYSLTTNTTNINEGGSVTYTLTTTNVPNGTVVYWGGGAGGTVTASDFGFSDTLTLSQTAAVTAVTINNNSAEFTLTAVNDLTTEGTETLALVVRGSQGGTVLATAPQVTVNDTSTTVSSTPTYQITPKVNGVYTNTVNEGSSISFEIITTNVPNGTVVYWGSDTGLTPSYNTVTGSDFGLSDSLIGAALAAATAVTINNNIGAFTLTATNDMVTENTEILSIIIKATSDAITNAGVLARADMVFVFDTSKAP